jgi:hypothetical protein
VVLALGGGFGDEGSGFAATQDEEVHSYSLPQGLKPCSELGLNAALKGRSSTLLAASVPLSASCIGPSLRSG